VTENGNWLIIKVAEQRKSLLRWFGLEPWEYLKRGKIGYKGEKKDFI